MHTTSASSEQNSVYLTGISVAKPVRILQLRIGITYLVPPPKICSGGPAVIDMCTYVHVHYTGTYKFAHLLTKEFSSRFINV